MNRTKLRTKTSVRPDQAMMTAASSFQAVKTLISSGFGCITWIRALLSDDNFVDGSLYGTRSGEMLSTSSAPDSSQVSSSSTKVKIIKRNFSTEADSLLDYIDGIYDALEKQYLKSFVFAIYLDEENPNDLVEAYTFTISYQKVADTDITAPIMSLATNISRMGLIDGEDPVSTATSNGRVPTLGDVKRSVRLLIKRLVTVCQQLDPLPDRRFATFKIHYNDTTPQEYEPPHFVAGDAEKDRFVFSTHGVSQPPERFSIGGVGTGQHDVQVDIASICSFLPTPEDNNAPFTGHAVATSSRLDYVTKEAKRKADNHAQLEDAGRRRVVWNAEPFDNTSGEKDPAYERQRVEALNIPLGVRRGDKVEPIPGIVRHTGGKHVVPGLDDTPQETEDGEDATQILGTQATVIIPSAQQTPRATQTDMEVDAMQPEDSIEREDIQMQGEFLRLYCQETQPTVLDPTQPGTQETRDEPLPIPKAIDPAVLCSKEVACDCSIPDSSQETFICQGECGRRLHAWCMGFNNAHEAGHSPYSLCLGCGAKEQDWYDLLGQRDLVKLSEVLSGLAQYRRALKLIYTHGFPGNPHALGKLIGCTRQDAIRIINRLEGEGFIESRTVQSDELGMLATETAVKNTKGRRSNKNKSSKPKLVLVKTAATEANFNRYFDPRGEIVQELFCRFKEQHLNPMKLKKPTTGAPAQNDRAGNILVPSSSINLPSQGSPAHSSLDPPASPTVYGENDTQTQEETQMVVDREPVSSIPPPSPPAASRSASKRKGSARSSHGRQKRLKVSLANSRVELDTYETYE
ncbi:HORMA domain-containing protein [Rhizoctonia solani]|nr:HORMA domain-containing protein [Rhizoctonia solani]